MIMIGSGDNETHDATASAASGRTVTTTTSEPTDDEASESITTPTTPHSQVSHDIGDVLINKPSHISDVQKYTYLKNHVKPPTKMFSKVTMKGGKLVTLTYQESWMSSGRAFWHVYSPKLNGS